MKWDDVEPEEIKVGVGDIENLTIRQGHRSADQFRRTFTVPYYSPWSNPEDFMYLDLIGTRQPHSFPPPLLLETFFIPLHNNGGGFESSILLEPP